MDHLRQVALGQPAVSACVLTTDLELEYLHLHIIHHDQGDMQAMTLSPHTSPPPTSVLKWRHD